MSDSDFTKSAPPRKRFIVRPVYTYTTRFFCNKQLYKELEAEKGSNNEIRNT